MSISKRADILLETGTNELEIMEFTIAGDVFGINVAKVTEIMQAAPLKEMPNSHPFVEGVFKPRDKIITVVNLAGYMNLPKSENSERDMFIITSFNKLNCAFHVHTVEGIHRVSWKDIEKPDTTIYGGQEGVATGIAKFRDKLITIVDFEKIIFDISPESGINMDEISAMGERKRDMSPILVAEDSALLRNMILQSLHEAGYTNAKTTMHGEEAWQYIEEIRDSGEPVTDKISLIITDIEMPKMDGHRLTKLVKEDPKLKNLPVIIFSSLINDEMRLKGEQVGANGQLSKPEIGNLVRMVDELLEMSRRN